MNITQPKHSVARGKLIFCAVKTQRIGTNILKRSLPFMVMPVIVKYLNILKYVCPVREVFPKLHLDVIYGRLPNFKIISYFSFKYFSES